jgi:hypothetical protein
METGRATSGRDDAICKAFGFFYQLMLDISKSTFIILPEKIVYTDLIGLLKKPVEVDMF